MRKQPRWSAVEIRVLKRHYPKAGALGVHKLLPRRARGSIRQKANLLCLKAFTPLRSNTWTKLDFAILKRYYPKEGAAKLCRRLPGRSIVTIRQYASRLDLQCQPAPQHRKPGRPRSSSKAHWTKAELRALARYYPIGGAGAAMRQLPGRSIGAIWEQARAHKIPSLLELRRREAKEVRRRVLQAHT